MNIGFIKKVMKVLEESNLEEIEIQRFWTRVKISKNKTTSTPQVSVSNLKTKETEEVSPSVHETETDKDLHIIKSPMVGTFYRAPSPEAPPYIDMGDMIKKGDVICIIEAMKIMNEIESDVKGKIEEVLISNEDPVEYNQPLFLVRKV